MDLELILKLGFFIIVILVSAVSQFLKERPKKRPQPPRPQRPDPEDRQLPPRPQANVQAQPNPAQPQPVGLEAEIEDFLRQVTGQSPKPAPPAAEPVAAEPMYAEPEVVEAEPVTLSDFKRESVSEHVEHHMRESGIDAHDAHLASGIEQRDEEMDSHLHEVFDHNLGTLAHRKPEATKKRTAATGAISAVDVLAAFESPDDIRKAIIMNEILTPKSLDW